MDILKRLQSQAEQVEVVEMRHESTTIAFEANRLKTNQVEETAGLAVRVVKDGRLGFAASSDVSAVDKLIANVLESAAYGEAVSLAFPAPQPAPQVVTYDQKIVDLPIARMVEIGEQIVELLLQVEPEARIDVRLVRGVQQDTIRNQTGHEVSFRRSPFSLLVSANRVKGDDVLLLYDMMGGTIWQEDVLSLAQKMAAKLKLAQNNVPARSGQMPVLFSPSGALALALPLLEGLDGKNVYKRTSPMAGRVGDKLFDDKLTVVDDATLDGQYRSAPYDDEGVAHRRTVLVEQGVLAGFLYDLKTAAQSGVASTGNGSRSLFAPPHPEPTNLLFQAGQTPLAEMIAGIEEGLLVEDLLGLGQGNILSGAFSNPCSLAFKIERGEIVGRVKDVSIAGNIYDDLRDVAAVSRETEWVYSELQMPSLLLPAMNVVCKGS